MGAFLGGHSLSVQLGTYSSELLRSSKRIGLFDSGVGGLSVLRQLQSFAAANAQDVDFVYLGDTARCPYGNRQGSDIVTFVKEIVTWLNGQNVDAIVMACNTSAAMAFEEAQAISRVPVLDLISHTAQYVATHATKAGVMATNATATSKAFSKAIHKVNAAMEVVELGCPELVPIVEGDKFYEAETTVVLNRYIDRLRNENVDTLILGCTHFPFLKEQIARLAEGMLIVDPAEVLTFNRKDIIERIVTKTVEVDSWLTLGENSTENTEFYVTGRPEQFEHSASRCLGQPVSSVSQLSTNLLAVMLSAYETDGTLPATAPVSTRKNVAAETGLPSTVSMNITSGLASN
jgi:glutamate racemase